MARAVAPKTTRNVNFFQRDGQWYGPHGQPICHTCLRPEEGDASGPACYTCGIGIDRIFPALRRERIEILRKQLAALEAAALEDMWRR
jgi:hypothetical protein